MAPLSSKMALAHVSPSLSPAPRTHWRSICQRTFVRKATNIALRCEQSSQKGNSVAVVLGRLVMVGFATSISVEIGTGKGLLENLVLMAPLRTVVLPIVSVMGVLAAVFIFQSASEY